jgi:hypothetical protein
MSTREKLIKARLGMLALAEDDPKARNCTKGILRILPCVVRLCRFLGDFAPNVAQLTTSSNEHICRGLFGLGASSEPEQVDFDQAAAKALGASSPSAL